MIYLDSNIFIYASLNNDYLGEKSRKILRDVSSGKREGYTSILTWDEVVYALWKKVGRQDAISKGLLFLKIPGLNFLECNLKTIFFSQELTSKYSLKPRDAIHVSTAILNKIPKIVSDDPDFDKISEISREKI